MATGKVARRTVVGDVAELLDSPEILALIERIDAAGDNRGRKGFGTRALVGACLAKSLFALPTFLPGPPYASKSQRNPSTGGRPPVTGRAITRSRGGPLERTDRRPSQDSTYSPVGAIWSRSRVAPSYFAKPS